MRPRRGFTLIEVLVTVSILAIVAAMGWRGVDGIVRTKDIAEARLDQMLRLNTVLAQWEADLAALHDTRVVPALSFDGRAARLTRRSEQGVQMVVWSLRAQQWHRWSSAPVTRSAELQEAWMRSLQLLDGDVGDLAALPGVAQWQLYFWRNNAWTNPQSTGDQSANDPRSQALPQGVRLVLTLTPQSGLSGEVTRDIVLRLRAE
ncbi:MULTISPECIES: prepilin-type N-terminal cleavage/methylation domain-containing protein [Caldimonas]|uniref:PulJ/GspJ family protein n=1 Tax=Caldimonas TaxID=196013 RepID=UPI00035D19D9|nr:prepilin-type N-terminal cleavage/methylation domain-containing protein [Caldimonas manganoxidans]